MNFVYFIIAVLVIYFIYQAIHKRVTKFTALKETDLNTDLSEFRESHAVSQVIGNGHLNLVETITQKYERMCVVDPVKHRDDHSIPGLIKAYQDIISGKTPDINGENIPSEYLLGRKNPDYQKYMTGQARALKKASQGDSSTALRNESKRVVQRDKEDKARMMFIAHLVEQGLPLLLVTEALTDAKLNAYSEDDWRTFCRMVKDYLQMAPRDVVTDFVSTFDEKEILFDANKFDSFAVFHEFKIPREIMVELVRGRITPEQAIRMVSLHDDHDYGWDEAMEEVLEDDLKKVTADELRKSYGWKG